MGLLDRFKRRRRTFSANFSNYRSSRLSTRKPFEPKDTPRPRKTGFFARLLQILKIVGVLATIFGLIYLVFFTKLFEIQKVNVTGSSDTLQEQSALNGKLQEQLGKNLLTVNAGQIETELLEEYPYLKTLDVRRDFFHTLTVVLETYPNAANVRVDYEDGIQQFFVINEEGYISGSGISEESLPTIVMDVTGTNAVLPSTENTEDPANQPPTETSSAEDVPTEATPTEATPTEDPSTSANTTSYTLNQELIPKETLEILLESAKDFVGKFNMQVLEIHYLKQARELHLLTERHFSVWIDLTQDVNIQLTKLKKSLTSLNIYEANLNYIDLRISGQNGEKVIYRLNE